LGDATRLVRGARRLAVSDGPRCGGRERERERERERPRALGADSCAVTARRFVAPRRWLDGRRGERRLVFGGGPPNQ
jgi:hypothetical protein